MQTSTSSITANQGQPSRLVAPLIFLGACWLLWITPLTHPICASIDRHAAILLNSSLNFGTAWQLLWGYLNHQNENWLNVVAMVSINILGILVLPTTQRRRATLIMLYLWLSFQLVLLLTHVIFSDWLQIQRLSPSLVISPWLNLNDLLNIGYIKASSESCFPAGHVLVLVFWTQFTLLYATGWVRGITWFTAVLLTLPRLISGAHWLSDIVFTIAYGSLWVAVLQHNFIFRRIINR